jgi:hypothetical protein
VATRSPQNHEIFLCTVGVEKRGRKPGRPACPAGSALGRRKARKEAARGQTGRDAGTGRRRGGPMLPERCPFRVSTGVVKRRSSLVEVAASQGVPPCIQRVLPESGRPLISVQLLGQLAKSVRKLPSRRCRSGYSKRKRTYFTTLLDASRCLRA